MHYRALLNVSSEYQGEEGRASDNRSAASPKLAAMEASLKLLLAQIEELKHDTTVAGDGARSKKVFGVSLPKTGAQRAAAVAAADPDKARKLANLSSEFVKQVAVLDAQGIKVNANGEIDWERSQATIVYDADAKRQGLTRVVGKAGKLVWAENQNESSEVARKGMPASTVNMSTHSRGVGYGIYVMSAEGNIHLSSHSVGRVHHSTLLGGASVAGAGEIQIDHEGTVLWISNKSGHYKPSAINLGQVVRQLQKMGISNAFQVYEEGGRVSPDDLAQFNAENYLDLIDFDFQRLLDFKASFGDPRVSGLGHMQFLGRGPSGPGFYRFGTNDKIDHRKARRKLREAGLIPDALQLSGAAGAGAAGAAAAGGDDYQG